MASTSQKQRDRDSRNTQMRRRILKAALKLFVRLNYEDVTIRKIAAAIGYSPATLYYYFKNKDALFIDLRQDGFKKLLHAQQGARHTADPRERLIAHARIYVNFALAHPKYYELMFLLNAPPSHVPKKDSSTSSAAFFNFLIEDVQLAVDSGVLPPARSTRRLSLLLLSTLHGLIALVQRGQVRIPSIESNHALINDTLDVLFEYTGILPASQIANAGAGDNRETTS